MVVFLRSGRLATFALLGMGVFANFASAAETLSCREIADAAANSWANGRILPIGPADEGESDTITVISYGKKYLVPRYAEGEGEMFPEKLGSLATQRNIVYTEELQRCLHPNKFRIRIITN